MDAKLKTDWVAALRSGEYEQGRGKLYQPVSGAFCCLGVLCKVAGLTISESGDSVNGENYLPISEVIGLDHKDHMTSLWKMNDGAFGGQRATFAEIADYIEENL